MLNQLEEIQKKGFVESLRKSLEQTIHKKHEDDQSFL
jgi:hypothetical protein